MERRLKTFSLSCISSLVARQQDNKPSLSGSSELLRRRLAGHASLPRREKNLLQYKASAWLGLGFVQGSFHSGKFPSISFIDIVYLLSKLIPTSGLILSINKA